MSKQASNNSRLHNVHHQALGAGCLSEAVSLNICSKLTTDGEDAVWVWVCVCLLGVAVHYKQQSVWQSVQQFPPCKCLYLGRKVANIEVYGDICLNKEIYSFQAAQLPLQVSMFGSWCCCWCSVVSFLPVYKSVSYALDMNFATLVSESMSIQFRPLQFTREEVLLWWRSNQLHK